DPYNPCHSSLFLVCRDGLTFAAQLFDFHSEDIEGLEYGIAVLPALVNPVLTLSFVRPYRIFVTSVICRAQRRVSFVPSGSVYGEPEGKLSLSQRL
ncbi:hypothetical protein PENTCL1PPCAC_16862, partial [Pristionchus entomophagus]